MIDLANKMEFENTGVQVQYICFRQCCQVNMVPDSASVNMVPDSVAR